MSVPKIDSYSYMSSVEGIYIIGEARGVPLLKNSINSGYEVMAGLEKAITYEGHVGDPDAYDVAIIGSGASGLSAAIEAANRGIKYIVLEAGEFANKLLCLPKQAPIYAVPEETDVRGELWFNECIKEELYENWRFQADEYELNIKTGVKIVDIRKYGDYFRCICDDGAYYPAKRIVIATGKEGLPKKLEVGGENLSKVYTSLVNPFEIVDKEVCIAGQSYDACKTALKLLTTNNVTMVVKEASISDSKEFMKKEVIENYNEGRIKILFEKEVINISEHEVTVDGINKNSPFNIKNDIFFSMTGKEDPTHLFKRAGLKLKGDGDIFKAVSVVIAFLISYLLFSFVLGYYPFGALNKKITNYKSSFKVKLWTRGISAYASNGELVSILIKHKSSQSADTSDESPNQAVFLTDENYSPQESIRFQLIILHNVDKSSAFEESIHKVKFNATVSSSYMQNDGRFKITAVFSETDEFIETLYKYWKSAGSRRAYPFNDPFFYFSILLTLVIITFGFLALNKWSSGQKNAKKSYQRVRYLTLMGFQLLFFFVLPYFIAKTPSVFKFFYPWPLLHDAFINKSILITIAALVLFTIAVPVFVLWHGKRFCSWVCAVGSFSETLGDNLRGLAPRGSFFKKLENFSYITLTFSAVITLIVLILGRGSSIARTSEGIYRFVVMFLLLDIVTITLIPIFGSRVFCRFFCPLSRVMEGLSRLFAKVGKSRFKIISFDRCIKCAECTKHCQMGIDVMSYAKDGLCFSNKETSCIGCGICISSCPVDNLAFPSMAESLKEKKLKR